MRHGLLLGIATVLSVGAGAGAQLQFASPNATTGGFYGGAIAGIPDVNGDGRGDFIVGAPNEGIAFSTQGHAYIYSGASGALLFTLTSPHPEADGNFGECVAGIADVNGDGRGDVVIGAPDEDPSAAPNDAGRAYIYSGATGQLLRELISPTQQVDGEYGGAVAGIPDVDGDGRGDVAVGAQDESGPGLPFRAGRVHVYSGATGAFIRTLVSPFPDTGGEFGNAVAGIADINGDGRGDIIVGARGDNPAGSPGDCGRVYVFSGASGARLRTIASPGAEAGGRFGFAVDSVSDVNGDAVADIVVGAPREDPGLAPDDTGRAYIYSGATGGLLRKLLPPLPEAGAEYGFSVAGLRDLNGDGRGDVAVGAWNHQFPGFPQNCGMVHVYSGAAGTRLLTVVSPTRVVNGGFGYSVAGVPDTNNNGRGDIAVGSPSEGLQTGKAFLYRR